MGLPDKASVIERFFHELNTHYKNHGHSRYKYQHSNNWKRVEKEEDVF
jgi:hypothetical protein